MPITGLGRVLKIKVGGVLKNSGNFEPTLSIYISVIFSCEGAALEVDLEKLSLLIGKTLENVPSPVWIQNLEGVLWDPH